MANYKITPITTIEALTAYRKAWDALAEMDQRDGFFRSWDWQVFWFKHFSPANSLFTLIVTEDDEVTAIVPMAFYKIRILPKLYCTVLGFMGREIVTGDYLDILCESRDKQSILSLVVSWLLAQKMNFSLLLFGEVLVTEPVRESGKKLLCGHPVRQQESRVCPYITLPLNYNDYLQGLSKKFRSNVRYYTKKILESLGGQITVASEGEQIIDGLNDLFFLHIKRWQAEGVPCTFTDPIFQNFIKDLCKKCAAENRVKLYRIIVDNKAIAAVLMFYWKETAIFYQTGWDPDYKNYSPGVVLIGRTIQDAIDDGRKYYDFLRGDEGYKANWAKEHRTTHTLLLPNKPGANFYLLLLKLKDIIKSDYHRTSAIVSTRCGTGWVRKAT